MTDNNDRIITVKNSLDMNILGDNISDITDFAVEKYEFRHDATLSSETRDAAVKETQEALWEMVEKLKLKRQQILKAFFEKADETVNRVVSDMQE
ncbi:MAG: hypothetical protein OXH01_09790 [Bacteroidetes bacterium]|nr:hypothetical protein [Bacteroidota bacterium]